MDTTKNFEFITTPEKFSLALYGEEDKCAWEEQTKPPPPNRLWAQARSPNLIVSAEK